MNAGSRFQRYLASVRSKREGGVEPFGSPKDINDRTKIPIFQPIDLEYIISDKELKKIYEVADERQKLNTRNGIQERMNNISYNESLWGHRTGAKAEYVFSKLFGKEWDSVSKITEDGYDFLFRYRDRFDLTVNVKGSEYLYPKLIVGRKSNILHVDIYYLVRTFGKLCKLMGWVWASEIFLPETIDYSLDFPNHAIPCKDLRKPSS